MKIVVQSNHVSFSYRPRRLSFSENQTVNKIIDELLQNNIIRRSESEYRSPIALTKKKSGEYRLCVEFRSLNKITIRDNYPIPLIEDLIDKLRGKRFYTVLDFKSAFHHIDIEPNSIKYTSFVSRSI